MQASRLISVLLLLQARGRMSARELANEVEVSVRTIHRDIEQLSAAGVPVRAARGCEGGFELMRGWRTQLTGLTAPEAQAIFLAGLPGPASELGLGSVVASARLKLMAALPADWQVDADLVASRFYLDPLGWFRTAAPPAHLVDVAGAVWTSTRVTIRYESWKGVADRTVEPLGLVLKAGVWYLVGSVDAGPRTFRLSNILELRSLREPFERPLDFDLARYWLEWAQRFETSVYRETAGIRVAPSAIARLRELSPAVAKATDESARAGVDGWVHVTIPIESVDHAAHELLRLGAEVEVIEPASLREVMRRTARSLATIYADDR